MPAPKERAIEFESSPEKIAELAALRKRLAEMPKPQMSLQQFCNRKLKGEHLWSKQVEIAESLEKNRRTVVKSAHGTGKSFVSSRAIAWWLDRFPPGEAFALSCYTDDTEVLTKDGWKLFRDVTVGPDGDQFATRNRDTHEFQWQHAVEKMESPYSGEVVDFKSRSGKGLHLRVTPNHMMLTKWAEYKNGTKVTGEILKRADKITARGAEVPQQSTWVGESPETVTFGRHTWSSNLFASFLGAYLAEGSLGPKDYRVRKTNRSSPVTASPLGCGGSIALTQFPETKGYEPFLKMITELRGGVTPHHSLGKTWSFHCLELYHYLKPLGRSWEKYIPEEVKNWSAEDLRTLIHFYLLGDGWEQSSSGGGTQWRAQTTSKRLADDLQEIGQKAGFNVTIKERGIRTGGTIDGRVIEGKRVSYHLNFNTSGCKTVTASRSHYEGNVYCVSVPNQVLYVRRNNLAIWCGNSAPTFAQVRGVLWREIGKAHRKGGLVGRVNQTEWHIGGELVGFGRKPADQDPTAFQGYHAKNILVVLDEACHDDQTEVLTEYGWMKFEDLTGAERLLVMNPETHATHYQIPDKVIKKPYAGKMLLNEAKGSNWCVTPDHDMYFHGRSHNHDTHWRKQPAAYLAQGDDKYMKKDIEWDVPDVATFTIPGLVGERKSWPELTLDMDKWMSFLGWFFSEGCVPNVQAHKGVRYTTTIAQKHEGQLEEIYQLCLDLGLPAKKYEYAVHIHSRQLGEYLHSFGEGCLEKRIPDYARNASVRQINLFIDTFVKGDGYRNRNRDILYTSNEGMAGDLQEMVLKTGFPATVRKRSLAGVKSDLGTHVATSSVDGYVVSRPVRRSEIRHYPRNVTEVDYEGYVYCASVPPDALLFTRREGYTMWSGNCGIPKELWVAASSLMTNERSRMLAIGNPDDPASHFAEVCRNPGADADYDPWNVIQISAFDTPNFTGEEVPDPELLEYLTGPSWVADMRHDVGEGSPLWTSKVLGEFPQDSEWTVLPPSILAKAQSDSRPGAPKERFPVAELGMDVGAGGDMTVIWERRGNKATRCWRKSTPESNDAVNFALHCIRESLADSIKIDSIGVGWGVAGRLEELRKMGVHHAWVHKVNVSTSPRRKDRFPRLRDELWWNARLSCQDQEWDLSEVFEQDKRTLADLMAPRYEPDTGGKIKVEAKKDTKQRLGRSPDGADALLLAYYTPNASSTAWMQVMMDEDTRLQGLGGRTVADMLKPPSQGPPV